MIWIRADAGPKMGTGHVMRCMSIAEAAAQAGHKVCFLIADKDTEDFLKSKGVEPEGGNGIDGKPGEGMIFSKLLDTDYREMETELPMLREILKENPAPVLVDSYLTTPAYLKALKQMTAVAILDEDHRFPYPVDMIVNYNIFGASMPYGREEEEKGAKLLLGPSFASLRKQFQNVDYEVRPEVRKILLSTGGTDRYNLNGQILETFLDSEKLKDVEFCVVSGAMNVHYGDLLELEKKNPRVHIYSNVSDMAGLMKQCDLAITAGGSTVYELCAVGIPFLCFSFVDNQEKIIDGFNAAGLVPFGGNYLTEGTEMIGRLLKAVEETAADYTARKNYSAGLRNLVDSRGASRIARELSGMQGLAESRMKGI